MVTVDSHPTNYSFNLNSSFSPKRVKTAEFNESVLKMYHIYEDIQSSLDELVMYKKEMTN